MNYQEKLLAIAKKRTLIAAHRGSASGNIPCNTIAAFDAALAFGADIIECDVIESCDGELFVFHHGKEHAHLNDNKLHLEEMKAEDIRKLPHVNIDNVKTPYCVNTLDEVLEHLKGRCFINIDRAWDKFPQTVAVIRKHKIENQIILKSPPKKEIFSIIEDVASDIMYFPILKEKDETTEILESMNINYAGAEIVFASETSPVASDEFRDRMHEKNRLIWSNSIVYDSKVQLAAGHNDDVAVMGNPDFGWGWHCDRKYDIIQTDWPAQLAMYITMKEKLPLIKNNFK